MRNEAIVTPFARIFARRLGRVEVKALDDCPDDGEIIDMVLGGDTVMFGVLVKRYEDFVFAFARGILLSDERAEDVSQEVFIRAYRSLRGFERKSSFKTWLYRIAYNTSMSFLKKDANYGDPINDLDLEISRKDSTPPSTRYLLRKIIDKLDPELRAVIIYHYFDDLKYDEIAEVTGSPIGTVKVRLFRAKHELKKLLEKYALYMR
jgi:RNA polymerase sigma-70 factor (ECF subfamily)